MFSLYEARTSSSQIFCKGVKEYYVEVSKEYCVEGLKGILYKVPKEYCVEVSKEYYVGLSKWILHNSRLCKI